MMNLSSKENLSKYLPSGPKAAPGKLVGILMKYIGHSSIPSVRTPQIPDIFLTDLTDLVIL